MASIVRVKILHLKITSDTVIREYAYNGKLLFYSIYNKQVLSVYNGKLLLYSIYNKQVLSVYNGMLLFYTLESNKRTANDRTHGR